MSWPVAIALGAIVARRTRPRPRAVMRQVKLPHKLLKILEGESLLNDASALLVYRLAIMTVMAGHLGFASFAPVFLLTVFGSLAAGVGCAFALRPLTSGLRDVPISLIVQFATTFGVWIAAEAIGLSGILTLVAFAHDDGAARRPANAGAHARADLRGVGDGGLRAERVCVRVDRHAVAADPGSGSTPAAAAPARSRPRRRSSASRSRRALRG